jgi:hypothetical protein
MTPSLASESLAHAGVVFPVAALVMLLIAGHVHGLANTLPPLRRRLRSASGLVSLTMVPLAAYALAWCDPLIDQREFVLAWMMVVGLTIILLTLAVIDIAVTCRLHVRAQRPPLAVPGTSAVAADAG